MLETEYTTVLIQTKLYRPPLPVDLIPRPRLTGWLEQHRGRPLTLVSAPAGYGKSTLISCWLEACECPSAWFSLDEHDNDLVMFVSYMLAAIQTCFPNVGIETLDLLWSGTAPSLAVITRSLINELNQIKEPFILILDDYHLIETRSIHDLLNEVLLHPPRNLHLVLGTRMDPLLPLVTLRANSQVTEIRSQDLRFNQEETLQLFQKMIGTTVDRAALSEIDAQAEGWVTGLRLAALAMGHRIGRDSFQGELSVNNRYVTDYLMTEILAKQAAALSDCMLKTSILKRFCVDLCQDIYVHGTELSDNGSAQSDFSCAQFLEWLESSNLFVIPLDDRHEWFRYHHLFRDFLQHELTRRLSSYEISELHGIAGRWFARSGWIEEALYHLLAAGDTSAAIKLVARHRNSMLNTTQWPRLEGWLNRFSSEVVETSAELWMLKIWLVYHRGQWSELPALLEHLATIMEEETYPEMVNNLAGEISSLRSLIAYHAGDAEGAIDHARRALEQLPPELWIVRVLARTYLGGSLLLTGDKNGSYHAYYGAFEEEKVQNRRFKATMLMTACNFHWVTSDLQSMAQAAKQCIALCQGTDLREILGHGKYHLGRVRYQQNNLPAAEELFASVVASPYQNYGLIYTNSACGLGMTFQAQGREVEAREVVEGAIAFLLETGNTTQLPFVLALQAEVALRQGRLSVARQWAEKLDPAPPLVPMVGFSAPHLTLVKVWLAQNTPASLGKAAELLSQLQKYLARTHNTRFLIETLALQAMLDQALGEQASALAVLEKALRLAQPGGFIRLFVDLGLPMEALLSRLQGERELGAYITQILSAYPGAQRMAASMRQEELPEPLTNRELDVLALLAERKTNKEIALQLGITPGTVRQHSHNLYQKLAVSNRREAVTKAIDLGIFWQ